MDEPVPLSGNDLRSFERAFTLWGLKKLWRGLADASGARLATLRSFLAMHRTSRAYSAKLKPVRLGDSVKLGLYLPHWPSKALDARFDRGLSSNGVHHHEQVMLSVTDACPYRCPHCFNDRKKKPPMPLGRLRELVREIQDVGGSWICIHGGEPLVDMERTMAVVETADSRSEVWVATTGFDLDAATAGQFKEAGLFGACVSLHDHRPEVHDSFVGYPGAFKIAVEAIEHLRQAGIFVTINTALDRERITRDEILNMMKLARDLGAGMVEILFIRPAGRAIVGCEGMLATEDHRDLLEQAMVTFNKHRKFADFPVLVAPVYFEVPELFGCIAGNERLFISAAGDLQPCAMVNLSIGNVADESFHTVTERMRSLLPCPRKDLVCTHLQPLIAEETGSTAAQELPLPPSESLRLLRDLPESGLPGAYKR